MSSSQCSILFESVLSRSGEYGMKVPNIWHEFHACIYICMFLLIMDLSYDDKGYY